MTPTGDSLTDRFGASGVRLLETGPAVPDFVDAAAWGHTAGLVLPLRVNPYFHTLPEEPVGLRAYARGTGRDLEGDPHASWTRLGSDRAFDLCAAPDGKVWGVLLGYDEPDRFVSSSPALFAESLLEVDTLLEAVTTGEDPEQASAAYQATLRRLESADPEAFADPEHWWPLVLEDIRTTASVRSFATFEFAAPDGTKHLVSEPGSICVHAEERTWSRMYAAGVEPDQVTRIHTELEPCFMPGHYCSMWLEMSFPDASLTHNVSYGETAEERVAGIRELQAFVRSQSEKG
ncbi:nucleic acid/nucleotide deaminase domain-containing protein [Actinacidiphila glaucinigra]|uniref:nucleic acid/nucleotide deaminase domain-containing protein n=1 Tax=Actinacidiphila glaucinigra TaxID=235986 RepID=UPI0033CB583A